jgi:hypothetical protein
MEMKKIRRPIDFGAPQDMLDSLQEARKYLWGAPPQVSLIILSAVYGQNCEFEFASDLHLQLSKLALFAAGAVDCLTLEQYIEYSKAAKNALDLDCIKNKGFVEYIYRHATEKAANGRGYFGSARANSDNRYTGYPKDLALLTLAAQYGADVPDQISAPTQSLWLLCLYALGAGLTLNKEQYRYLTEEAHGFNSTFPPHHLRFQNNLDNVEFILAKAAEQVLEQSRAEQGKSFDQGPTDDLVW